MPTLKKTVETVCEVFCPEDKWPAMIQAGKKIREAGMVPKSIGRAIEHMLPEHLATLVLTASILVYNRRPIHEVAGATKDYFDLSSNSDTRTAGTYLADIISDELDSLHKSNNEKIYTVRVYLDKPEIEFVYLSTVSIEGFAQPVQVPLKTVRYGSEPSGDQASGAESTMMRATVDITSTALRAFAEALRG